MGDQHTLLINPPLWNAYAPHLAVPLLAGTLKDRGFPVRSHDASVELLDWLLSADGLDAVASRGVSASDHHLAARGALVREHTIANIDRAKAILRSTEALADPQRQAWARRVMRNATWMISSSFEGLTFDLVANNLYYSATSTRSVLSAVGDAERNIYQWAIDRMLPGRLLADPGLRTVGVSVSADTQLIAAMTIAARIKAARPEVKVIFGGNYATRMVERWTEPHPFFDLVDVFVMSEGEDALPQVISHLHAGESAARVPGAVTAADGKLVRTPAVPVRLESVSLPDFSDLPLGKYFAPGPILPVYASRSCAWNCAFCSIPFASNSFRSRPAQQVVDQLVELADRYGTNKFMFVDEILTLRVLKEVASEITRRQVDVRWYGETRFAGGFGPELARSIYQSGCRRLNFGLESYNQRVLDLMRKGTKVDHIDATLDAVLEAGVAPHLFVIHGFPGETADEAQRTVDFAQGVIQRAHDQHANPYATWGGSPFILDVHSPAAQQPEEFGLQLVEPAEAEDLALTRDYTVTQGLDSDAALRLARRARRQVTIRRNLWFRQATESALAEVEEFTFLRACTGTPNAEPLRSRLWRANPAALAAPVRLACTALRLPWVGEPAHPMEAVALYDGDHDHFVQLSWPREAGLEVLDGAITGHELAGWFTRNEVTWGDVTGTELVLLLLRHRFLRPDGAEPGRAEVGRPERWAWRREPGVLATSDAGGLVLHSPVSGNTVKLNDLGQAFWDLCATSLPLGETLDDLDEAGQWRDKIREMVRDLATLGFIYPHQPSGEFAEEFTVSACTRIDHAGRSEGFTSPIR